MRRLLIVGAFTALALAGSRDRMPTDHVRLNRFSDAYNAYVAFLQEEQHLFDVSGKRDEQRAKLWGRALKAWREMAE